MPLTMHERAHIISASVLLKDSDDDKWSKVPYVPTSECCCAHQKNRTIACKWGAFGELSLCGGVMCAFCSFSWQRDYNVRIPRLIIVQGQAIRLKKMEMGKRNPRLTFKKLGELADVSYRTLENISAGRTSQMSPFSFMRLIRVFDELPEPYIKRVVYTNPR